MKIKQPQAPELRIYIDLYTEALKYKDDLAVASRMLKRALYSPLNSNAKEDDYEAIEALAQTGVEFVKEKFSSSNLISRVDRATRPADKRRVLKRAEGQYDPELIKELQAELQ